eukprot:Pgem_evm1s5012
MVGYKTKEFAAESGMTIEKSTSLLTKDMVFKEPEKAAGIFDNLKNSKAGKLITEFAKNNAMKLTYGAVVVGHSFKIIENCKSVGNTEENKKCIEEFVSLGVNIALTTTCGAALSWATAGSSFFFCNLAASIISGPIAHGLVTMGENFVNMYNAFKNRDIVGGFLALGKGAVDLVAVSLTAFMESVKNGLEFFKNVAVIGLKFIETNIVDFYRPEMQVIEDKPNIGDTETRLTVPVFNAFDWLCQTKTTIVVRTIGGLNSYSYTLIGSFWGILTGECTFSGGQERVPNPEKNLPAIVKNDFGISCKLGGPLGELINAVVGWVTEKFEQAISAIGKWFEDLGKQIGKLAKQIGVWIDGALKDMGEWMENALNDIGDWLVGLGNAVGDAFVSVAKGVEDVGKGLYDFADKGVKAVGKFFSDAFSWLGRRRRRSAEMDNHLRDLPVDRIWGIPQSHSDTLFGHVGRTRARRSNEKYYCNILACTCMAEKNCPDMNLDIRTQKDLCEKGCKAARQALDEDRKQKAYLEKEQTKMSNAEYEKQFVETGKMLDKVVTVDPEKYEIYRKLNKTEVPFGFKTSKIPAPLKGKTKATLPADLEEEHIPLDLNVHNLNAGDHAESIGQKIYNVINSAKIAANCSADLSKNVYAPGNGIDDDCDGIIDDDIHDYFSWNRPIGEDLKCAQPQWNKEFLDKNNTEIPFICPNYNDENRVWDHTKVSTEHMKQFLSPKLSQDCSACATEGGAITCETVEGQNFTNDKNHCGAYEYKIRCIGYDSCGGKADPLFFFYKINPIEAGFAKAPSKVVRVHDEDSFIIEKGEGVNNVMDEIVAVGTAGLNQGSTPCGWEVLTVTHKVGEMLNHFNHVSQFTTAGDALCKYKLREWIAVDQCGKEIKYTQQVILDQTEGNCPILSDAAIDGLVESDESRVTVDKALRKKEEEARKAKEELARKVREEAARKAEAEKKAKEEEAARKAEEKKAKEKEAAKKAEEQKAKKQAENTKMAEETTTMHMAVTTSTIKEETAEIEDKTVTFETTMTSDNVNTGASSVTLDIDDIVNKETIHEEEEKQSSFSFGGIVGIAAAGSAGVVVIFGTVFFTVKRLSKNENDQSLDSDITSPYDHDAHFEKYDIPVIYTDM